MRETIVGTIVNIRRVRNSYYGNPRYSVTLDNGRTVRTAADHGFVYGPMPTVGTRVTLTLNGRGTVTDWAPAGALDIGSDGAL